MEKWDKKNEKFVNFEYFKISKNTRKYISVDASLGNDNSLEKSMDVFLSNYK